MRIFRPAISIILCLANVAFAGDGPNHYEEPGMQPGLIAEQMQLTPSTITRLIEKLEEKKLVLRATDGKLTNVYPTAKAREMKPLLKQCVDDFYEKYAKILGKEESRQLIQKMNIVADKLAI